MRFRPECGLARDRVHALGAPGLRAGPVLPISHAGGLPLLLVWLKLLTMPGVLGRRGAPRPCAASRPGRRPGGRVPAFTLALVLALSAIALPGRAQESRAQESRDDRVRELQEAIGEASAAEAAALRELADVRARRAELDAAVAGFDLRIREVEARIAALRADVERYTAEAADLDRRARETGLHLREAELLAADAAAELYRTAGAVPLYGHAFDVDNVQDLSVGVVYLRHVSRERREAVSTLADLRSEIERLEDAATARRDEAAVARREAEVERAELASLRAEQQRKRDAVAQQERREQQLVASIRDRKDEFTSELAILQASSNAISGLLSQRQAGQRRADGFSVVRPVPGRITSGFGLRVHPILGTTRMHNGVDMSGSYGTPIRAGAAGTVVFSGVRSGYGNTVIIDHGNQYATLYAHASTFDVTTGERVAAGERIAAVGASGLATGPHLHFEIRVLGVPVDPVPYL